jgi:hypothetical protein
MSAFLTDPIFTTTQGLWFGALLALGLIVQTAFSPRRRAIMGLPKFALASAMVSAPAIAGVTLVRGAYRLGYLEEGRSLIEANMRSILWMSGSIILGQLIVRFVPPMSWMARDLKQAGRAVWSARLNRWTGRQQ